MGDTGIIAVLEYCCPKEMLIPLLCGIFLVENLSVVYTSKLPNTPRNALAKAEEYFNVAFTSYRRKAITQNCYPFWIVAIMPFYQLLL
jgi:phospho-N-acetylmuramoyl-pentapeptide-transferase